MEYLDDEKELIIEGLRCLIDRTTDDQEVDKAIRLIEKVKDLKNLTTQIR